MREPRRGARTCSSRPRGPCLPAVIYLVMVIICLHCLRFPVANASSADQICPLAGLVEVVYNSTTDEYVYRDVDEESNPDSPSISAQLLFRKCGCNEDVTVSTDNILDRGAVSDKGLGNKESIESRLCPLEAKNCAKVYLDDHGWITQCYFMDRKTVVVRNSWPVLWSWYFLLTIALVFFESGRHAVHYGMIKLCGACCCFWCCLWVCCFSRDHSFARPFFDFGDTYNSVLVQRMLRVEASERQDRRDRWNVHLRREVRGERNETSVPLRDRIPRWLRILPPWWNNNEGDDNSNNNEEGDEEHARNSDPNPNSNNAHSFEQTRYNPFRELNRKHGLPQLVLSTRIYSKSESLNRTRTVKLESDSGNSPCRSRVIDVEHVEQPAVIFTGDNDGDSVDDSDDDSADSDYAIVYDSDSGSDSRFEIQGASNLIARAVTNESSSSGSSRNSDDEVESEVESEGVCTAASKSMIEKSEIGDVCIICLGPLEDGDRVGDLPYCDHVFHTACLKTWITRKNNCPLCMKPLAKPTTGPRTSFCVMPDGSIRSSNHSSMNPSIYSSTHSNITIYN